MQRRATILAAIGALALSACNDGAGGGVGGEIPTTPDPIVAATLNDPLMIDPDLVHRSDANALLSIRYDHALPPHGSTTESAEAARDAASRELLETGAIEDLPLASTQAAGEALALGMTATEVMKASGAPNRCLGQVKEGLVWAARLPDAARVMPHGMVMQAAGAQTERCKMRIIRYVTPVGVEDALRYHFNRANRAGMTANRYSAPEDILKAERGSEHFQVYVRPGPGGTSAVDLIYWRR
jgi:hypothetical protein